MNLSRFCWFLVYQAKIRPLFHIKVSLARKKPYILLYLLKKNKENEIL